MKKIAFLLAFVMTFAPACSFALGPEDVPPIVKRELTRELGGFPLNPNGTTPTNNQVLVFSSATGAWAPGAAPAGPTTSNLATVLANTPNAGQTGANNVTFTNTAQLTFASGSSYTATTPQVIGPPDANLYFSAGGGAGVANAAYLIGGSPSSGTQGTGGWILDGGRTPAGTDAQGADCWLQSSLGTGLGTSAIIRVQCATKNFSTGTTAQTRDELLDFQGVTKNLSGAPTAVKVLGSWSDGGNTSTTVAQTFGITPTYNYSAASKTGSTLDLLVNRTETSLPTGRNDFAQFQVAGTAKTIFTNAGSQVHQSAAVEAWTSSSDAAGTIDTGLSRDAAGVMDFGTGAQGSKAGSWNATSGTLGAVGVGTGSLVIKGTTSGSTTITVAAAAGSPATWTLPTATAPAGGALTDVAGNGTLSWVVPTAATPTLGAVVNAGNVVNSVGVSKNLTWTTGGTFAAGSTSEIYGPTDTTLFVSAGTPASAGNGRALTLSGGLANGVGNAGGPINFNSSLSGSGTTALTLVQLTAAGAMTWQTGLGSSVFHVVGPTDQPFQIEAPNAQSLNLCSANGNFLFMGGASGTTQVAEILSNGTMNLNGGLNWNTGGTWNSTQPELLGPTDNNLWVAAASPNLTGAGNNLNLYGAAGKTTGAGGIVSVVGGAGTGSNQNSGGAVIDSGPSTGTGTSVITLKAPPVGSSGSAANTSQSIITIDNGGTNGVSHGELLAVHTVSAQTTLSTSGTSTNTIVIPAGSWVLGVETRITTTITTATNWKVTDNAGTNVFIPVTSTLTSGTTVVGTTFSSTTFYAASNTFTIITTGTPGAGVIRVTAYYITLTAPTS